MKLTRFIFLIFLLATPILQAQEITDTTEVETLVEVILIGSKPGVGQKISKPLATIDEYLQSSSKVDMIKRGAYAWEPMINGMATERTVITIDGMRIFSACTDKMDPITSYVEVSNLSEANISSGQHGSENGATIGGSIDLKRHTPNFAEEDWKVEFQTGGESNGEQKIVGGKVEFTDDSFFVNTDITYRNAENYTAGGREEVEFSQFTKFNVSATAGYKLSERQAIEASVIYDQANDVGYPALPMDVSLARAIIGSLQYDHHKPFSLLDHWESKVYFNTITHQMDDSQRPNVPIRMDMPGWSDTFGFYSKGSKEFGKHSLKGNINAFYNKSLAEMTMFPNDPSEREMFMLTWPDVQTLYSGLYLEDEIVLNEHVILNLSGSLGRHSNSVESAMGLQSLRIFYPEMEAEKARFLKSLSSQVNLHTKLFNYSLGLGYGDRAPSVSEAYGFYLFNSFDGYDYIGNPHLKNEKSLEVNAAIGRKAQKWHVELGASFFHIRDYIIGKSDVSLSPMTIGANGMKVYEQLDHARIFNSDLSLEYRFHQNWNWKGKLQYNQGRDSNNENLPLIQPLTYQSSISFRKGLFSAEANLMGSAKQKDFNPEYGEDQTAAYAIAGLAASQTFYLNQQKLTIKIGAENIFDTYYSTYSDWNNIPRRGRNVFVNLAYVLR